MKSLLSALLVLSCLEGNASPSYEDDFTGNVHIVADRPAFQIVETGDFHASDLKPIPSEGWLALVHSSRGYSLRPTSVHTTRIHDDVVDDDESRAKSGLRISTNLPQPLFLVRGLHSTKPEVITTFVQPDGENIRGAKTFSLNGRKYTLQLLTPHPVEDGLGPDSRVVLKTGEVHQTIAYFTKGGDRVEVIWVGDLDNDGKLDLYLNISGHYNISHKVLYLSGGTKSSELVQAVAEFTTTGC